MRAIKRYGLSSQRVGKRFLAANRFRCREDNGQETSQASESPRDAGPNQQNILVRAVEGGRYLVDVGSQACIIPSGHSVGGVPARALVERLARGRRQNLDSERRAVCNVFP
jgi:hypothetical protein